MKSGKEMVEIFGRCSRLLNKIVLNAEDDFFSRLCAKESDKLLSAFIFFLKREGEKREHHVAQTEVLQHQDVAKPADIVQCGCRVAQYRLLLTSRIKSILNLLDILRHLGLAKPPTSLLLEKNLLLLKLLVLDIPGPTVISSGKRGKPAVLKPEKKLHSLPRLNQVHEEILGFIKSKEQTQNMEVFNQFAHISRRTLKKKLSELAGANIIKRIANGKKVFYSASAES